MRDQLEFEVGSDFGGVIIWDTRTDIVRIDANLCGSFQVDRERGAHGIRALELAELIGSDDLGAVLKNLRSFSSETVPLSFGFVAMLADGSRATFDATGQFFHDGGGDAVLFVGCLGKGMRMEAGSRRSNLVSHCVEAYRLARDQSDVILQHLLSMALIELGRTEASLTLSRH